MGYGCAVASLGFGQRLGSPCGFVNEPDCIALLLYSHQQGNDFLWCLTAHDTCFLLLGACFKAFSVLCTCRWAPDYPAYNEYVRANAENLINKPAPGVSGVKEAGHLLQIYCRNSPEDLDTRGWPPNAGLHRNHGLLFVLYLPNACQGEGGNHAPAQV
jgi:hypothetical protein